MRTPINNTPKSKDIKFLIKNGEKTRNAFFTVFTAPSKGKPRFFAANIAKKSIKKSSDRNRQKRWIREVYRKHKKLLYGLDVLVMPRPGVSGLKSFNETEKALLQLFTAGR
ncbi:MAG TPA: ribonuclease P protein component [Candidatus Goldiibacteriota bacterium]|nr:ribonuclease P protein component [Candidatus Goldiibacteriota bacterium]